MFVADVRSYGSKIPYFCGVYNIKDIKLLTVVKYPASFICLYKEHFMAVSITDTHILIFDPLGFRRATIKYFKTFLIQNIGTKKFLLSTKIQGGTSTLCGEFCLVFLSLISKGYTFTDFLALFTCKYRVNNKLVSKLFSSLFPALPKKK